MKKKEIIILGALFVIIISCVFITAFPNNKSAPSASISTSISNSEPLTPPTYQAAPPVPDSVINNILSEKYDYISNLTKEENVKYRANIVRYMAKIWRVLAQMDWKAENYLEASQLLLDEIAKLEELEQLYLKDYEVIIAHEKAEAKKWKDREEEYPVATKVWLFLKEEMGYSDVVCAGILGNMMAECGGQTLELQWWVYNSTGHYGLCQWSPKYYKELSGASLEQQLEFMKISFPKVFNGYGDFWYEEGFDHDSFMSLTDVEEVAYIFCVVYERPGPGSYNVRRENAIKAYEYFTS